MWGDSPARVLDDVAAARARKQMAEREKTSKTNTTWNVDVPKDGAKPIAKPVVAEKEKPKAPASADPMKNPPTVAKTEPLPALPDAVGSAQAADKARQLMRDGRKALRDGQIEKAEDCARKADALKPNLGWWEEDTPAKLLADVQAAKKSKAVAKGPDTKLVSTEPKILLHQAHEALDAGKFDEAVALAQKAKIAPARAGASSTSTRPTSSSTRSTRPAQAQPGRSRPAVGRGAQLLEQAHATKRTRESCSIRPRSWPTRPTRSATATTACGSWVIARPSCWPTSTWSERWGGARRYRRCRRRAAPPWPPTTARAAGRPPRMTPTCGKHGP